MAFTKNKTIFTRIVFALLHSTLMVGLTSSAVSFGMVQWKKGESSIEQQRPIDTSRLTFYWEGKEVGSIPVDIASSISPVFKAKLEGPFGADRYKSVFSKNEFSKEAIELLIQLINESVSPQVLQNTPLISELVALADMYDITHFNRELNMRLAQELPKPEWYNADRFPLPRAGTKIVKEIAQFIANSSPYSMVLMRETIIIQHGGSIVEAAFSPDGRYVVTASDDHTAKISALKGQTIATIQHGGRVKSAAFSPDGRYVVTVSEDGTTKISDLKGQTIITIQHNGLVNSAAFSPDGGSVVTVSLDGTAIISDLKGQTIATIQHNGPVESAAFSPDGRSVVTASWDGTAKISDLKGQPIGQTIATIQHGRPVRSAAFSPDGGSVVTASDDGTAIISDLNGQTIATIQHGDWVNSAVFGPDGRYVVTASFDGTAKISDLKGHPIATIQHGDGVWSVAFSPDGRYVVTASADHTAKISDLKGQPIATIQHDSGVYSAKFSRNGRSVVTASWDNTNTARITPLGFVDTDMPADHILAIVTLVRLALDMRHDQSVQPTLNSVGWVYKAFVQLPVAVKNRLQGQFPEIGFMVTNTIQEQALGGLAELFGQPADSSCSWSSMLTRYCTIL